MNKKQVVARQVKGFKNMVNCKDCKHYVPVDEKHMWNEWRKIEYGCRGTCQFISDSDMIRAYDDSIPLLVHGDWGCKLHESRE